MPVELTIKEISSKVALARITDADRLLLVSARDLPDLTSAKGIYDFARHMVALANASREWEQSACFVFGLDDNIEVALQLPIIWGVRGEDFDRGVSNFDTEAFVIRAHSILERRIDELISTTDEERFHLVLEYAEIDVTTNPSEQFYWKENYSYVDMKDETRHHRYALLGSRNRRKRYFRRRQYSGWRRLYWLNGYEKSKFQIPIVKQKASLFSPLLLFVTIPPNLTSGYFQTKARISYLKSTYPKGVVFNRKSIQGVLGTYEIESPDECASLKNGPRYPYITPRQWRESLLDALADAKDFENVPYQTLSVRSPGEGLRTVDEKLALFLQNQSCRLLIIRGKAGAGKTELLQKFYWEQLREITTLFDPSTDRVPRRLPIYSELRHQLKNIPTDVTTQPLTAEAFLIAAFAAHPVFQQISSKRRAASDNDALQHQFLLYPSLNVLALLDGLDEVLVDQQNIPPSWIEVLRKEVRNPHLQVKWIITVRSDDPYGVLWLTDGLIQGKHYQLVNLEDLDARKVEDYCIEKFSERTTLWAQDRPTEDYNLRLRIILGDQLYDALAVRPMWLAAMTDYLDNRGVFDQTDTFLPIVARGDLLRYSLECIFEREEKRLLTHGTALFQNMYARIVGRLEKLAFDMDREGRQRCSVQQFSQIIERLLCQKVTVQTGVVVVKHRGEELAFAASILQHFFCAKYIDSSLSYSVNGLGAHDFSDNTALFNVHPARAGLVWSFLLENPSTFAKLKEFLFTPDHLEIVLSCLDNSPAYLWRREYSWMSNDLVNLLISSYNTYGTQTVGAWKRVLELADGDEFKADLFAAAGIAGVTGLKAEAITLLRNLDLREVNDFTGQIYIAHTRIQLLITIFDYLFYVMSDSIEELQIIRDLYNECLPRLLDAFAGAELTERIAMFQFVLRWGGPDSPTTEELCRTLCKYSELREIVEHFCPNCLNSIAISNDTTALDNSVQIDSAVIEPVSPEFEEMLDLVP